MPTTKTRGRKAAATRERNLREARARRINAQADAAYERLKRGEALTYKRLGTYQFADGSGVDSRVIANLRQRRLAENSGKNMVLSSPEAYAARDKCRKDAAAAVRRERLDRWAKWLAEGAGDLDAVLDRIAEEAKTL